MINKDLFIEVSRERRSERGSTGSADLMDATESDIINFKSRPCNKEIGFI